MIILSYNIRGGGNRIKKNIVGYLIQKADADVCFIQESKLRELELGVVMKM